MPNKGTVDPQKLPSAQRRTIWALRPVGSPPPQTILRGWRTTRTLVILISISLLASVFMAGLVVGRSGHLGSDIFEDVPEDHWANKEIGWAVSEGITQGVSDTRFDPNGTVSRAQIVTFLYRVAADRDEKLPVPSQSAAKDWADDHFVTLNRNSEDPNVYGPVADDIAEQAERLAVCGKVGASYATGAAAELHAKSTSYATTASRYMAFAAYGLVRAAGECATRQNATVDVTKDLLNWADAGLRLVWYGYNVQGSLTRDHTLQVGDIKGHAGNLVNWATAWRDDIKDRLEKLQD